MIISVAENPQMYAACDSGIDGVKLILVDEDSKFGLSILSSQEGVEIQGGLLSGDGSFMGGCNVDQAEAQELICGMDIAELQVHKDSNMTPAQEEVFKDTFAIAVEQVGKEQMCYC